MVVAIHQIANRFSEQENNIMIEGRQLKDWLRGITKDQNLEDLDHVSNTRVDGLRRWFRSAELVPTLQTGYYDEDTGTYAVGMIPPVPIEAFTGSATLERANDTSSAATYVLTPPAGHLYVVVSANIRNSTDVASPTLFATVSGTAMYLCDSPAAVNVSAVAIGFQCLGGAVGGNTNVQTYVPSKGFPIQYGDTMTLSDQNFTAGDTMRKQFLYWDITLR